MPVEHQQKLAELMAKENDLNKIAHDSEVENKKLKLQLKEQEAVFNKQVSDQEKQIKSRDYLIGKAKNDVRESEG